MNEKIFECEEFNARKTSLGLPGTEWRENGMTLVISLQGSLDTDNSSLFTETLNKIIQNYPNMRRIVLVLDTLRYISSTGVGSLTTILKSSIEHNRTLVLSGMNEKVKSVLDMLGFTGFFTIIRHLGELQPL